LPNPRERPEDQVVTVWPSNAFSKVGNKRIHAFPKVRRHKKKKNGELIILGGRKLTVIEEVVGLIFLNGNPKLIGRFGTALSTAFAGI
jgi:hypothetical protein